MALHDYRKIIDTYPNRSYITIEISTDELIEIGMLDDSGDRVASIRMQKQDAGLVLNAIAGAIKTLEGLDLTAADVATKIGLHKRDSGLNA